MQTFSFEPTWSPNGLNIAFVSNMTGTYHIWVLSTTGGSQGSSGSGY
jgi:Tol biopolymer transport system component